MPKKPDKRNDFELQWRRRGEELREMRYPQDEATLNREIRRAMWDNSPRPAVEAQEARRHRWLLPAAACLLALLVPTGIHALSGNGIHTVSYEGQRVLFACNTGCSVESMVQSFNELIVEKNEKADSIDGADSFRGIVSTRQGNLGRRGFLPAVCGQEGPDRRPARGL